MSDYLKKNCCSAKAMVLFSESDVKVKIDNKLRYEIGKNMNCILRRGIT